MIHFPNAPSTRAFRAGRLVLVTLLGALLASESNLVRGATPGSAASQNRFIAVVGDDLKGAVDRADPGDTILADPQHEIILSKSVLIDKPLTLLGLRAKLAPKLGSTQLIIVTADDFRFADFHLSGNNASVSQEERAALIQIRGSRFVVERGICKDSAKDGIEVTIVEGGRDVRDGVIRDIVGFDNVRDHISISGLGRSGLYIRNLVVHNIRAYRSRSRGAVEVSDGTENITVQDVYAEGCVYGVDVQDHKRAGESNIGVRISNVFTRGCKHAIRTDNQPTTGHRDLTLRNISGTDWPAGAIPLQVSNTRNVVIDDIRIADGKEIDTAVFIRNCHNLTLQSTTLDRLSVARDAIRVEDSSQIRLHNLQIDVTDRAGTRSAIRFVAQSTDVLRHFDVHGVTSTGEANRIILARQSGGLEKYRIQYPNALVDDGIKGAGGRIVD